MSRTAFILVPLVLLACGQEPAATAVSGNPAFNYMNNPDNGNFRISRYQGALAACWTDPATGLRACHATIPLGDGGSRTAACKATPHRRTIRRCSPTWRP